MQQIKKLSLKLFIHYSEDWDSLMWLGGFIGEKKTGYCGNYYIFGREFEVARSDHQQTKQAQELLENSVAEYMVEIKL